MNKLNLNRKDEKKSNFFGMSLPPETLLFLKRRIEDLAKRCPSSANISLNFEKRKSCIKGTLRVNRFSENFISSKVSPDPIQTYLLMQEDIEAQLLDWKRNRFSKSLFNSINSKTSISQNCA